MPKKDEPDYARITAQGLQEDAQRQAVPQPRLADTPSSDTRPPGQQNESVQQFSGEVPGEKQAQLRAAPGPRLADTPPPDALPPRQQAAPAQRSADTPPPAPPAAVKAENVQNLSGAIFLFGAAGKLYGSAIDIPTFKAYLDSFLKDAGAPTDPVERMLLEQLALAHHAIGRLHFRAGTHESLEAVTAYHAAAARLQAEFRRSALALQAYREAAGRKQASAEPTRPAKGKGKGPAQAKNGAAAKIYPDSEMGSNHNRVREYLHDCEPALS